MLAAEVGDPATTANQLPRSATRWRSPAPSRPKPVRGCPAAFALARQDVTAAGEVIDTPELAGVRRQLADLRQRLAAERASRGETRPVAAELQAQIGLLTEDARGIVAQVLERLDLERRIRAERIEALQRESTSLQQVALALEPAQVAITDSSASRRPSQELYVVLLTRLNEITAQKESIAPDARVLNGAVPPEAPTGPRRGLYAGLAGLAGLLGFTGAALAADALGGAARQPRRARGGDRADGSRGGAPPAAAGAACRPRPRHAAGRGRRRAGAGAARAGRRLPAGRAGPCRGRKRPPRCSRRGSPRRPRGAGAGSRSSKSRPIRIGRPRHRPPADPPHRQGGRRRRRGDRRCSRRRRRCAPTAATADGLGARHRLGQARRRLPRRGRRAAPQRDPVLRLVHRLREAGAAPDGVVAVAP